jgi:hypothetical protein
MRRGNINIDAIPAFFSARRPVTVPTNDSVLVKCIRYAARTLGSLSLSFFLSSSLVLALTCELRNKDAHEKNPNETRPQFTSAIRTSGIDVDELVAIGSSHVHETECHHKISNRRDDRVNQ